MVSTNCTIGENTHFSLLSKGIPLTMENNELVLSDHEDIIESKSVIGWSRPWYFRSIEFVFE